MCCNGIDLNRSGLLPRWLVAAQNIKDLCQCMLIESKMPKEKVRRARMTVRKDKVKMPRARGRKEKEIRKEKKVTIRVKANAKIRKTIAWQRVHLWKAKTVCQRLLEELYSTGST